MSITSARRTPGRSHATTLACGLLVLGLALSACGGSKKSDDRGKAIDLANQIASGAPVNASDLPIAASSAPEYSTVDPAKGSLGAQTCELVSLSDVRQATLQLVAEANPFDNGPSIGKCVYVLPTGAQALEVSVTAPAKDTLKNARAANEQLVKGGTLSEDYALVDIAGFGDAAVISTGGHSMLAQKGNVAIEITLTTVKTDDRQGLLKNLMARAMSAL